MNQVLGIYQSADRRYIAKVYLYDSETGKVTFQRESTDGRTMPDVMEVMDQAVFEVAFPNDITDRKKFPWAILVALGTAYLLLS
ncbi:MAG: hypothetical protein EBU84_02160 [Actinobacteria bacterium]|nr:hypothetical protein [Actinomycetota bacterium]